MKTIVRIKFGSHLYGTSTPTSDVDFKSVHLPSASDILLQRVHNSVSNRKAKEHGEKNLPNDVDEESYSLQRFLQLASEGQTVALDMLFAPQPNLIQASDTWNHIQFNRDKLLTKKSAAFVGYCRQQANKYGIKGSRVAAAKAATEFFATQDQQTKLRELFFVALLADHSEHIRLLEQEINSAGDKGWFLEVCNRKISFDATAKQGYEIVSRIYQNYGDRARKAQGNEGVDWKALSHAVRVGTQSLELLRTHHMTFPLPNKQEVLDIKQGKLSYEAVADRIETLLAEVEEAALASTLPDNPEYSWIDKTVSEAYLDVVTQHLS